MHLSPVQIHQKGINMYAGILCKAGGWQKNFEANHIILQSLPVDWAV